MTSFFTGIFGIGIVMGIWFGVQALARRQGRCGRDQDMLEGHGCGACEHFGACRKGEKHADQ